MLSRVSDEWCFCYELSTCIGNFLNAYKLENASVQEKTQKLANILDRKLFVQWLVFICVCIHFVQVTTKKCSLLSNNKAKKMKTTQPTKANPIPKWWPSRIILITKCKNETLGQNKKNILFFTLQHLNVQKVIMIRRIGRTHKLPIEKSLTFPNNNKFYHFHDLL